MQLADPRAAPADDGPLRAPAAFGGNPHVDYLTGDFTVSHDGQAVLLTHTSAATFRFRQNYVFDWPRYHLPKDTPSRYSHGDVDIEVLRRRPEGHWTREGSEEEWLRQHGAAPGTRLCHEIGRLDCRNPAVAVTVFDGSGHMGMDRVAHCAEHGFDDWATNPPAVLKYLAIESRLTEKGTWQRGEVLFDRSADGPARRPSD